MVEFRRENSSIWSSLSVFPAGRVTINDSETPRRVSWVLSAAAAAKSDETPGTISVSMPRYSSFSICSTIAP